MNLFRTLARIAGYDVVAHKHVYLARHLRELLRLYRVDCVIDVGANHGKYALLLREMGYDGEIHSFEPLRDAFAELEKRAGHDPKWFCYRHALGGKRERREIAVTGHDVFSSFLRPTEYSAKTFQRDSRVERVESVEIQRLDEALAAALRNKRAHLKMDTQGFDLEVFAGVGESLERVVSLQSEISARQLYEGMPDYIQALQTYKDAGFLVSGMFPVSRDRRDFSLIEMDCVMVKDGAR